IKPVAQIRDGRIDELRRGAAAFQPPRLGRGDQKVALPIHGSAAILQKLSDRRCALALQEFDSFMRDEEVLLSFVYFRCASSACHAAGRLTARQNYLLSIEQMHSR